MLLAKKLSGKAFALGQSSNGKFIFLELGIFVPALSLIVLGIQKNQKPLREYNLLLPTRSLPLLAMSLDPHFCPSTPQPGEIWEIATSDSSPVAYAAIVREIPSSQSFSVMLFSIETTYVSAVDILIPAAISGLERDLLAETWNVGAIARDSLRRPVGQRLSRELYDLLLSIGDLAPTAAMMERIEELGLKIDRNLSMGAIDKFHQQEKRWLQGLDPRVLARTEWLMAEAMQLEREFRDLQPPIVSLSGWLQRIIESDWLEALLPQPQLAIATRSPISVAKIAETIDRVKSTESEIERRQLIVALGAIAQRQAEALAILVELVNTTQDDETLWVAAESLRQAQPDHPRAGIRRMKTIGLAVPLAPQPCQVDLVVNIIEKIHHRIGILIQVYSHTPDSQLPPSLRLALQDVAGVSLREAVAGAMDYCIQLKFNGEPGERFNIGLALGDELTIENFII
jgi:Protein of unknown function (DUF1822)